MKNKDIRRNGSGYYDETAFKAISGMKPQPGEIWTHKVSDGLMLVLNRDEHVCACLKLGEKPAINKIMVRGKTMMWTNPIMVGYCFDEVLEAYVKTMPDTEFLEVQKAVKKALGLSHVPDKANGQAHAPEAHTDENSHISDDFEKLVDERDKLNAKISQKMIDEYTTLKAKIKVLEDMNVEKGGARE